MRVVGEGRGGDREAAAVARARAEAKVARAAGGVREAG